MLTVNLGWISEVETEDMIYVIEVKGRNKLEDPNVIEKSREGTKWCEKVSKISNKSWKYYLLPHDNYGRGDSVKMVVSNFAAIP